MFLHHDRDRIAVALSVKAAADMGFDRVAFPSEETLRRRWPDITDSTVGNYGRLAEYAKQNTLGVRVFRYGPDLRLKPA